MKLSNTPPVEPLRIFIGYDPRQPLAYTVLQHSIARHASVPVAITPLILSQLPIKRRGLTEFTFSRFLVPWLCSFKGMAVFMDADMVVTGDIAELFNSVGMSAVSVNKRQATFEWASVMVFSCGQCLRLTPEFVDDENNKLYDLAWAPSVGEFPAEWNHCVGYQEPSPAKLYHYTQGLPCWDETSDLPESVHWQEEHKAANSTVSWMDLMRGSVHAKHVLRRLLNRYKISVDA